MFGALLVCFLLCVYRFYETVLFEIVKLKLVGAIQMCLVSVLKLTGYVEHSLTCEKTWSFIKSKICL